ncbi:HlyD family efflux transporter periplasmic adaptor subunit [Actinocrinis puniceicyclus]|uniref:HlyD family efflux transporter periplasmic adaptor subunit n=1 Tax=Actinocrinis puniceicyclus TaxID=977794 RepID=A0A8J7WJN1_9ACTN|nr:HlyD family efflux transporter periplasmic adaptor subunit [Actinocrinis puniceicyclus]MBS2962553.1 HlyD family efflux transporter periplasmic adaptor subunit [Actinocrinis puniceicyclus]
MTPLKSSRRRLVLNGSLAALVLAGAGVAYTTVGPATSAGAATTRTSPVQRGTVIASVSASGNLALAATSSLAFGAAGKVSEIDVKVGQTVAAGQVLAKIDPTLANLQLTEAQQQLTVARDNLAKAQNGPSSTQLALNDAQLAQDEQAVTNAQNAYSTAKCTASSTSQACAQDRQAVTNAENALTLLKAQQANSAYVDPGTIAQDQEAVTQAQANVNTAQTALAGTVITAPGKGTILSIAGLIGSSVSAGSTTTGAPATSSSSASGGSGGAGGSGSSASSSTSSSSSAASSSSGAFITMADLSQLQVTAQVSETDVSSVQIGQSATVTLNATGKAYPAQVEVISPTSTVVSNVVEYAVTLNLTEAVAASVRPGQSASISIVTGEASDTLYVPNSAITTAGGRSIVTVVGAGGKETITPVTTGIVGTTDTQIVSGLTQGENVLLTLSSGASTTGGRGFGGLGGFGGGLGGGGGAAVTGGKG